MTVGDSVAEVVDSLERAMKEGYDMELIEAQKRYAKELLLTEMESI